MECYAGRSDTLRELLKVAPGSKTQAAFADRTRIGADADSEAPLELTPLAVLSPEASREVVTHLAL